MTSAFAEPPDTSLITIRRALGTIEVRPAPRREPPFDDEIDTDGALAASYDRPLPFERTRRGRAAPIPVLGPRPGLPDPVQWARRLLIGVIEAAAGRRPLNQLTSLLSPSVAAGLRDDLGLAAHVGQPHWTHNAALRSVRASSPADEVVELSATLLTGPRVRAIAPRLEVRHGRWYCTRLVLG